MRKEVVSDKQAIAAITIMMIGSAIVFVEGLGAKNDIWISVLIAIIITIPIMIVYATVHSLWPGKNVYDLCEICFGKYIGKAIILILALYFLESTNETVFDFGLFMTTIRLDQTPELVPIIIYMAIASWIAKEGIEVLCRWSSAFVIIPVLVIFTLILFLLPEMDIDNIRPVLSEGLSPVLQGAYEIFTFPFAYIMAFIGVFKNFRTKKSPYIIYITSTILGGIMLFIIYLTTILVLGAEYAEIIFYPNYRAFSHVSISFVERIEILSAIALMLGGIVEVSIYLIATCKGIAKVFGFEDYRFLVTPISLAIITLTTFEFEGTLDYFEFGTKIWPYYSFPFQVLIPIILVIGGAIRKKTQKNHLK